LSYIKNDKIISGFNCEVFTDIKMRYAIYSEESIIIEENEHKRIINIPKLQAAYSL